MGKTYSIRVEIVRGRRTRSAFRETGRVPSIDCRRSFFSSSGSIAAAGPASTAANAAANPGCGAGSEGPSNDSLLAMGLFDLGTAAGTLSD
jgi:hypothetical protein